MEERNYTVYMHVCPNGKKYIGMTGVSLTKRFQNGKGYKNCILFNEAILYYGWDKIEHKSIYSDLTKKEAECIEKSLIKEHRTQEKEYGYNIQDGGECPKHSEETKKKIGSHFKGENNYFYGKRFVGESNPFYGKTHTEKTKNKLRKINLGKKVSKETREKQSSSQIGKHKGVDNPMYGRIGELNPKSIKCCIDGFIFNTLGDLAKHINISITTLSPYLTGSKSMPQKWLDRGLRYYNSDTDKELPIYVDTSLEV